jgi:hypothetical protein
MVTRVKERLPGAAAKRFTRIECAECHLPVAELEPLLVDIITVKSRSELTVFIHDACYSSKILANETEPYEPDEEEEESE